MRPINLIPPEERRGDRAPLRAGPLSYVVIGFLLLAFLGVYLMVSTGNSISERESQLASLEQQLESTQARAEALQSFTAFASMELTRTETVANLARSRFDWERVLTELALVVPADISLTSATGEVSPGAAAGGTGGDQGDTGTATPINAPTLAMSGCASGHEAVARFVAALRDIDGVTRVGLETSADAETDSAAGAATASPTAADAGECAGAASFDVTIAFDEVVVDPTSGGVVPTTPAPEIGDGSGVAEAQAERERAKDSAASAEQRSNEAIDTLVPGA